MPLLIEVVATVVNCKFVTKLKKKRNERDVNDSLTINDNNINKAKRVLYKSNRI